MPKRAQPSGELSSSQKITTGNGVCQSVVVHTDGTNDALGLVYDNGTNSGTIIARVPVVGADNIGGILNFNAQYNTGLYVELTGTGAKAQVYFNEGLD